MRRIASHSPEINHRRGDGADRPPAPRRMIAAAAARA
jgi:hypothetical protein